MAPLTVDPEMDREDPFDMSKPKKVDEFEKVQVPLQNTMTGFLIFAPNCEDETEIFPDETTVILELNDVLEPIVRLPFTAK